MDKKDDMDSIYSNETYFSAIYFNLNSEKFITTLYYLSLENIN